MIALSFSGGKDSCLALYELQQKGRTVRCLFTTVWEENNRTVAHEESLETITKQAKKLGIPIYFVKTTFETYEQNFIQTLQMLKKKYQLTGVAFGDWYLTGHREWGEKQAQKVGLNAHYPLWAEQGTMLQKLEYFVELGFVAKLIKVDQEKLPAEWVGRKVDAAFIADIAKYDVCPMGESGEYHTTVIDGPIFS